MSYEKQQLNEIDYDSRAIQEVWFGGYSSFVGN